MKTNPQLTSVIALSGLLIASSCQPTSDTSTQSQGVHAAAPRPHDPRADRFAQRRAAAERQAREQHVPVRPGAGGGAPQAASSSTSSEYWYVVHSLQIDSTTAFGFAGFDLDNHCSGSGGTTGCGFGDTFSDLDLDQNLNSCAPSTACQGCVDNIAPIVANVLSDSESNDIRAGMTTAVNAGKAVWLLRLVAVEDLNYDTWVLLALYRGYSVDYKCSSLFGGNGNFVVSNTSLWVDGDVNTPRWFGEGSIAANRYDIRFGSAGGQSETGDVAWSEFVDVPESFELKTYQLRLRATLSYDGLTATLGNAGAWSRADEFREAVSRAFPQSRPSMDALIPQAADLPLSGQCGGSYGTPVGAIGLGFRYATARANITGTTSTPPAGYCGSPTI